MARTSIPAAVIVTCDICKLETGDTPPHPVAKQEAKVRLTHHVLDMYGAPAASREIVLDMCDGCFDAYTNAVNALSQERRNPG